MSEPGSDEWRMALLFAARRELAGRANARAEGLLRLLLDGENRPVPPDQLTFVALRLLGELIRKRGDLPTAQAVYLQAQQLAGALERPELESAAVEGLAMLAEVNDDVPLAVDLFRTAARLARQGGDEPGRATVLSNLGNLFRKVRRLDEAEAALREALGCPGVEPRMRAIMEDNLAQVLAADGRLAEAITLNQRAAEHFGAEQLWDDRYKALRNLSSFLAEDGKEEESGRVFAEAHALMQRLAAAAIDATHYEAYPERVKQIEAETERKLREHEQEDAPVWLEIGMAALLGDQLMEEGERRYEAADYDGAERALLQALAHWEHLGAFHAMPGVHRALGMLYTDVGQPQRALQHLLTARQIAANLGDARREYMACLNLARLTGDATDRFSELDTIEQVARARALLPLAARQLLGGSAGEPQADEAPTDKAAAQQMAEFTLDYGVLDSLDASIFFSHHALDLAEAAIRRSAERGELLREQFPDHLVDYRLALRLIKLHGILVARAKTEDAAAVAARLDTIAAEDPNPRTAFAVNSHLGEEMFRANDWSTATLDRLMDACAAYEELRGQTLAIAELGERVEYLHPPFAQATEVALQLGQAELAFHLLERSKARSLLEALRGQDTAIGEAQEGVLAEEHALWRAVQEATSEFTRSPDGETPDDRARRLYQAEQRVDELQPKLEELWRSLADDHPAVIAHRMAKPVTGAEVAAALAARPEDPVVIEFFAGPRTVSAFILDSAGGLRSHRIADSDDEHWMDLRRQVAEADADDGDITDVLGHPALAELAAFVGEVAAGRPAFIIPHRFLHQVPLHLAAGQDGTLVPRPRTYHLPSASLLRYSVPVPTAAASALVGGDPLGDLEFASLEAATVAGLAGVAPALGARCDPAWLSQHLAAGHPPLRLIHLACHALFHPRHAERSGILLAGESGPVVMDVWKLAALDWNSELTVLSACASGQQQIRSGDEISGLTRTLIASGTRSLIVALWSVPDLATYLLMTEFYGRLPAAGPSSLADTAAALAGAQRAVRDLSARDLVARALELRDQAVAGDDERTMICAMSALTTAHRSAGNRDEWLRWREAIRCRIAGQPFPRDLGLPDWNIQRALGAGSGYDAAPFAAPRNWAAFVLVGR